jgi:tRNA G18 (ribose-2'-O)-methylase SpoU
MQKLRNHELGRKSVEEYKKSEKIPVIIVLDNVRSLNNIGSIFRTSDAFLIRSIHLCGITACPPNKEINKTALGATDSVSWKYYGHTKDAINDLKTEGYQIISIEQTEGSISLERFYPKEGEQYAFVFGHEVKGVNQEIVDLSDVSIEIPQFGTKHSLNISVSAGIVIWDIFNKFRTLNLEHGN